MKVDPSELQCTFGCVPGAVVVRKRFGLVTIHSEVTVRESFLLHREGGNRNLRNRICRISNAQCEEKMQLTCLKRWLNAPQI